jgi:hypothetical protein
MTPEAKLLTREEEDAIWEHALRHVPEGHEEEFMAGLEALAKDPRFEVRRDSRGRVLALRARRN